MSEASARDEVLVTLTSDIVAAHVSNNSVAVSDLPVLIQNVYGALAGLQKEVAPVQPKQEPAVSIRSSVKPDFMSASRTARSSRCSSAT